MTNPEHVNKLANADTQELSLFQYAKRESTRPSKHPYAISLTISLLLWSGIVYLIWQLFCR